MKRVTMKCLILVFVACAWANEDLMRDVAAGNIEFTEMHKRALLVANDALSIKNAARSFASAMGSGKSLGSSVANSALSNSCLKQDSFIGSSILTKGGIPTFSKFGGIATAKLGKRETKMMNRDMVFLLDTSGSIPNDQFEKAKKAITLLVESFCPTRFGNAVTSTGNKQIAVALFGATNSLEIDFTESSRGLGYLTDKILDIKHRSEGSTGTTDGLTFVRNSILGKGASRLNNAQVSTDVIVITDGQCNRNCMSLGVEADRIRKMGHGVNVFAMGVANARLCELEILSGEGSNLAYGLSDFRNFDRFAQAVKEIAQENASKCA